MVCPLDPPATIDRHLENKLRGYRHYYNEQRYHSGREGQTPMDTGDDNIIDMSDYLWKKHCRRLFELPVAA